MTWRTDPPKAVYIHIPFCTNKCYYCDFNSYVLKGQPVTDYLRALKREMELTVDKVPPATVESVFVGGGTPSVLSPDQMAYFLQAVNEHFPLHEQTEFTVEINPGTVDEEKLHVMKEGGVNRLSFGVQSFDDRLLKKIGRIHNTDDVFQSLETARKVGFENISIDLMFSLPEQTPEDFAASVDQALALRLPHISAYSLKVEENTLFYTLYEKKQLLLPSEDEELEMYRTVIGRTKEAGYRHYEISNFAWPGFESRHNQTYWKNESYYGLGAGAHGYVLGKRHVNVSGVQEYIEALKEGLPVKESWEVTENEAMEEHMILGLRLLSGVRKSDFYRQFQRSMDEVFQGVLEKLMARRLIVPTSEGYRLSEEGLLFGNLVFAEFLDAAKPKEKKA